VGKEVFICIGCAHHSCFTAWGWMLDGFKELSWRTGAVYTPHNINYSSTLSKIVYDFFLPLHFDLSHHDTTHVDPRHSRGLLFWMPPQRQNLHYISIIIIMTLIHLAFYRLFLFVKCMIPGQRPSLFESQ
jgi:hypothetical protein